MLQLPELQGQSRVRVRVLRAPSLVPALREPLALALQVPVQALRGQALQVLDR